MRASNSAFGIYAWAACALRAWKRGWVGGARGGGRSPPHRSGRIGPRALALVEPGGRPRPRHLGAMEEPWQPGAAPG